MIAFGSKVIQIQADHPLWAGINTQVAAFAVELINFYPSLYRHSQTSKLMSDVGHNLDDIYYLHYQFIITRGIVLTVTDLEYKSLKLICGRFADRKADGMESNGQAGILL